MISEKKCTRCEKIKPVTEFYTYGENSPRKGKLHPQCRKCTNEATKDYQREYKKGYYKETKEMYYESCKKGSEKDPERHVREVRKWRKDNPKRTKEHAAKSTAKRLSTPEGRLNNRMRVGMGRSLRDKKAGRKWESLIEYSLDELISHLESLFMEGMSWDNMEKWDVDHIKPVSSFNCSTPENPEFKKCWALDNLQPLWHEDNLRKGVKIV